jgi:hypothetical protein
LITSMIIGALVVAALLANVALRSPMAAVTAVAVLAAVGVAASLAEPFVAPVPTAVTVVGALALGAGVTEGLLRVSDLRKQKVTTSGAASGSPEDLSPVVRSRETHSEGGTAVSRRNFLVLGGGAAAARLAALGAGRVLAGRGQQAASAPKPLKLPKSSEQHQEQEESKRPSNTRRFLRRPRMRR